MIHAQKYTQLPKMADSLWLRVKVVLVLLWCLSENCELLSGLNIQELNIEITRQAVFSGHQRQQISPLSTAGRLFLIFFLFLFFC